MEEISWKDLSIDEGIKITGTTSQPKPKIEAILTFQNITIHLPKRVSWLHRKMFYFLLGVQIENISVKKNKITSEISQTAETIKVQASKNGMKIG